MHSININNLLDCLFFIVGELQVKNYNLIFFFVYESTRKYVRRELNLAVVLGLLQ